MIFFCFMVSGLVFLFMFTHRSFSFGTIKFSLLNITIYKLPEGNGTGSYSYISCNFVCGSVNHRDSAWSSVTATVHHIYIRSIWGDCNSTRPATYRHFGCTALLAVSITETLLLSEFVTYANGAKPTVFNSIKNIAAETKVIKYNFCLLTIYSTRH